MRQVSIALFLATLMLAAGCAGWLSSSGPDDGGGPAPPTGPAATLPTSLHGTASGMQWWYEQPNGAGALFGVSWADTGCGNCHIETCDQCHTTGFDSVDEPAACRVCHSRIGKEEALGVTDLHFTAGMVCSDCHLPEDSHGDGNTYNSMLASPNADCEDCHSKTGSAVDVPATNSHTVHGDAVSCDACHMSSAVTCYNCHFETLITSHEKVAAGAFKDFIFLLNDADGQVRAGTYQSVEYNGSNFVAFGPFHGHSVVAEGRGCSDCHGNERIQELNADGKIVVTRWDDAEGKIVHTTGAIPFVPEMLELQFVTRDGDGWVPTSTDIDQLQYEFCTPLSADQLEALGYSEGGEPTGPAATLPTSLHGTASGMQWWYEQPDGAGALFDVSWDATGCGNCHVETCDQCHVNADGTGGVNEPDACKVCHGRIGKEEALGITDLHFAAGMVCSECHLPSDVHGDGTTYDSMLETPNAMCEDCHNTTSAVDVPATEPHTVHDNLRCDACHMSSAVTCYNCHLQTLLDTHEKVAAGAFKDFIFLLNDDNGDVRAGTYQSVEYNGTNFIAFGPFHGHSVTGEARGCEDCHANARIQELFDTGKIVVTSWDPGESKVVHTTGAIPFVPEALEFQFVTRDGDGWIPTSTDIDQLQYKFCTPLTEDQLEALRYLPPQITLANSLHGTANGMQWWYEQPDGAGALFGVDYADTGCGNCHTNGCDDCHANADGTGGVTEPDACLACHGRIGKENALELSDLHFAAGMVCSDCHNYVELHGDGTLPDSQFSDSGLSTVCEDCHDPGALPSAPEHTLHGGDFHCDACHVESVITCYNCHLETLLDTDVKKAAAAFKNFVLLLNGPDGRLRTGTYQSVVYEDDTFIAFGPFHGHTVTAAGRVCDDCHDNDRVTELNDTGAIQMTWWDVGESKVVHTTGVVPFAPELFEWQFVTLDGENWIELTTDLTQYQVEFCDPLTTAQLAALGVE